MDYYTLMEVDFISSCPKFENTDSDYLLFSEKQEFTTSSASSSVFWVADNLAKHFHYLYHQAIFLQVKAIVLRC
jgi:hypothetical protein